MIYCLWQNFGFFRTTLIDTATATPPAARRKHSANEIRSVLQSEIETGHIPPGAPLDERALAERFGVSRTPVREALQQLAALELVRIAPRHGVFASRLSIPQLRAQLELLCELEAITAKLAARRMSPEERMALQDSATECEDAARADDAQAFLRANTAFHKRIYRGSHNEQLVDTILSIRRLVQRYRPRIFTTPAARNRALVEHRRVCEAIVSGDEDAAHAAMLAHAPSGSTGFAEFLSTMPPEMFDSEPSY